MFTEDELLPLSGLQHLVFCERQWALIHIEQQWAENRLTAEGRVLHEKAHEPGDESRGGVRICRGLRIRSLRLGLSGQADVVEFHHQPAGSDRPFPIEYKRGRPKPSRCDEVQLCAQALCLEEMLGLEIERGAIFYGQPRRRMEVEFSLELRKETETLAERMRFLYARRITPPAVYLPKCDRCSLFDICLPKSAGAGKAVKDYVRRSVAYAMSDTVGEEL